MLGLPHGLILLSPEYFISGIPESREDVTDIIKTFIYAGGININVRMFFFDLGNPFGGCHQEQTLDCFTAGFLEQVNGGNESAAGAVAGAEAAGGRSAPGSAAVAPPSLHLPVAPSTSRGRARPGTP